PGRETSAWRSRAAPDSRLDRSMQAHAPARSFRSALPGDLFAANLLEGGQGAVRKVLRPFPAQTPHAAARSETSGAGKVAKIVRPVAAKEKIPDRPGQTLCRWTNSHAIGQQNG